jgi:hypothetical protein
MRHFASFLGSLLIVISSVYAKPVGPERAKTVGENFILGNANYRVLSKTASFELVYTSTATTAESLVPLNCFYVFNINNNGFVIVAADDRVNPILAYSDESVFDPIKIPINVSDLLAEYTAQIHNVIETAMDASPEVINDWQILENARVSKNFAKKGVVGPLVQTKWNQTPAYSSYCPFDSTSNIHCVPGCVATAMAQIMKYWNYPLNGKGHHKYKHPNYGVLSVNFDSATYNWGLMPNTVNMSNNEEVARLMYHAGVGVKMNYSPTSSGALHYTLPGDTALRCAETVLKYNFGYSRNLKSIFKNSYTPLAWYSILKSELDAGRPILFSGDSGPGDDGHCFINDGYDNYLLHINWGWGGAYDGYFATQALTPTGVGIGGGGGDYSSSQVATIDIIPEPLQPPIESVFNLNLAGNITIDPVNPAFGQNITIQAPVHNASPDIFIGAIRAGLYDRDNNLLQLSSSIYDYGEFDANTTLNFYIHPGWGQFLAQGTYKVQMVYKHESENWHKIEGATDSIVDSVFFAVQSPASIVLATPFVQAPTFFTGQPIEVNLSLINKDSSTFYGEYAVNLYDSRYDNYIGTLGTYIDSAGLVFNTPKSTVVFTTDSLTILPGSVRLKAVYRSFTDPTWKLIGDFNYQNPSTILVTPAPLKMDSYENNNLIEDAFMIPIDSLTNSAVTISLSANCHVQSDIDYYVLSLRRGFRYLVSPELFDAPFIKNGLNYSLDAQFAYSLDGISWSNSFDNTMPTNLSLNGGGMLYFKVSPFFAGDIGTYLLNLTVQQTVATHSTEALQTIATRVYPNPAHQFIEVEISENIEHIELFDSHGKRVFLTYPVDEKTTRYHLPINELPSGLYILSINTKKGMVREKVLIEH